MPLAFWAAMARGNLERRRFPRVTLLRSYHGAFRLRDIGLGGFAVESPLYFAAGEEHDVEFTLSDGRAVLLRAAVAHCVPVGHSTAWPNLYVSGFSFVRAPENDAEIEVRVRTVLASALSEPTSIVIVTEERTAASAAGH